MCTVTFIAHARGYALGMNRDEKLDRSTGLPPVQQRLGGRTALFPSEPNGGTWIGVNSTGTTFALINWYAVSARVADQALSRGQVVKSALAADSPAQAEEILRSLPLRQIHPFRLIGVFASLQAVVEWRWDLRRLEPLEHRWRTNTWISSGFDEVGAQRTRGEAFRRTVHQCGHDGVDWLRRLHRSHGGGPGPYSHCMHRDDAATVSYTEITVSRRLAKMCYTPGAPCSTPAAACACLPLQRERSQELGNCPTLHLQAVPPRRGRGAAIRGRGVHAA